MAAKVWPQMSGQRQLLAHRVISLRRNDLSAFGAKRTLVRSGFLAFFLFTGSRRERTCNGPTTIREVSAVE